MDSSGIQGQGGQALAQPICHEIMPKRQSVSPGGGGPASYASFTLPASSQEPSKATGAGGDAAAAAAGTLPGPGPVLAAGATEGTLMC